MKQYFPPAMDRLKKAKPFFNLGGRHVKYLNKLATIAHPR